MKAWRRFLVHILVVLLPAPFVDAHSKYPKTIYALQQRYLDEIIGVHTYLASAQKALSEDNPNIACLLSHFPPLNLSRPVISRNSLLNWGSR
jgi:hypothetical protein